MRPTTCYRCWSAAALVLVLAAGTANAAGFYLGAGGGAALYDIDYGGQVTNAYAGTRFTVTTANFESSSKGGYKAFAGYQFADPFAVELAYVNLGKPNATYIVRDLNGFNPGPNTRYAQYDIQGLNLSAVGTLPLNDAFSLHGMLGAFFSQLKYSESGTTNLGDIYSFTASTLHQTTFSFGLGATYRINPQWEIRADWDRFHDIGNTFSLTTDGNGQFDNIDLLSLNIVYRF